MKHATGQQRSETLLDTYERFFRRGGYRLMRLLVLKAEFDPQGEGEALDVAGLVRLQHSELTAKDYAQWRKDRETERIAEVRRLDAALGEVMCGLSRNWGEILDMHFGRGIRTASSGTGIRRRTVENALSGICRKLVQETKREVAARDSGAQSCYDFEGEGVQTAEKLLSYLEAVDQMEPDVSESLIMRAVDSMKLFRRGQQGIVYSESLKELREKTCSSLCRFTEETDTDAISACMVIREETRESRQLSGLEKKVRSGSSSILIDRMYEIYSIMAAIKVYLPEKYDRMMSFHWTKSQDKLTDLFREAAGMIAASEDAANYL